MPFTPLQSKLPTEAPKVEEKKGTKPYPLKKGAHSLLLVPLCLDQTSQFEGKTAAKILAKELLVFLASHQEPDIRIRLLSSPEENEIFPFGKSVEQYLFALLKKNSLPNDLRFSHEIGTLALTTLEERFVVCQVTWRFKPNHSVTRQVVSSTPSLLLDAKSRYLTAAVGKAYLNWIPDEKLFRKTVQGVLLVHGPNMHNVQKPNCLEGDYSKGEELLQACYASLFEEFSRAGGLE